jgi:leucyl/phenylalanyl-tRNA--protein transferase
MVLMARELRVGRSLKKRIKQRPFTLTCDTAFREVITRCRQIERPDQEGTWLTDEMVRAYVTLHELGFAHSAEAWRDGELVGGLYGVSLGAVFFGESMFATASDASKIAFVHLVEQLLSWGIELVDCQVHTDHLARFGAVEWPRPRFLKALEVALEQPTRRGVWTFESS